MNRKVLFEAKRDFSRFSFILATVSLVLTLVLWFAAPPVWHLLPECIEFYCLGVWAAEVKVGKLQHWLIPLIIMAVAFPIILQDIYCFIITGYFVFVWSVGYSLEKKSQKRKGEKTSHE